MKKKRKNIYACIYVSEELMLSNQTSKEIKSVTPKEINPEHSLEELRLKLQYFGHQTKANSSKDLILGRLR